MKKTCYFCTNYDDFNIQCNLSRFTRDTFPKDEPCGQFTPTNEWSEYEKQAEEIQANETLLEELRDLYNELFRQSMSLRMRYAALLKENEELKKAIEQIDKERRDTIMQNLCEKEHYQYGISDTVEQDNLAGKAEREQAESDYAEWRNRE